MEIKVNITDKVARMAMGGRFDFSAHRNFRETTEDLLSNADVGQLELDLSDVSYVDSSALGMLLMLRDKARHAQREVRLSHCSAQVRQVLDIANFGKLFRIDSIRSRCLTICDRSNPVAIGRDRVAPPSRRPQEDGAPSGAPSS